MTGGGGSVGGGSGEPSPATAEPVDGADPVGPATVPAADIERELRQITEAVAASALERIISPSLADFLA